MYSSSNLTLVFFLPFRIDKYIRSFLSEISQQIFQDANFNHIKQLWPTASRFYEGAYELFIQILNSELARHSFLDTNEYKTVAFRLKMLCRSLQSWDQLVKQKFMNLDNAPNAVKRKHQNTFLPAQIQFFNSPQFLTTPASIFINLSTNTGTPIILVISLIPHIRKPIPKKFLIL